MYKCNWRIKEEVANWLGLDDLTWLTPKRLKEFKTLIKKYDMTQVWLISDFPMYSGNGKILYKSKDFIVVEN